MLEEISDKEPIMWPPFSKEELINAIEECNSSSTPRPDKLSWKYLKKIVNNEECINKFIDIANTCIDIGYWLSHFKVLSTIIISKPNKASYNFPKSYCPIVLLNMIGKLFEKIISERLQFLSISNNFIHSCQLDRLKYRSTIDTSITLTYFVCTGWVKNLTTSTLAFNIIQFFLLLNYQLLSLILNKTSFDHKILFFFRNYLVGKKTKYL